MGNVGQELQTRLSSLGLHYARSRGGERLPVIVRYQAETRRYTISTVRIALLGAISATPAAIKTFLLMFPGQGSRSNATREGNW